MATSRKLVSLDRRRQSPLTPELKAFIDRVVVPILVRDYLSGIASEKQITESREGVSSCESMPSSPDAEGRR